MSILIEDTARNNLVGWTLEAMNAGHVRGAIISPFTTPRIKSHKQGGQQTAERLLGGGAEAWFDPVTHALQMPNVGDLRYYADWDLWEGMVGALTTRAEQVSHVRRVFKVQDDLGVPHLGPTILLHSAQSTTSERALEVAQAAVDEDPGCRLSIAGDSAFWSGGAALDAHVGALAQLEPGGWFISVVRSLSVLPVPAMAEEVHGLCRTVRSLSEDGPVHVSHGDLAGLPAVVAGAATLGTGWDPRQRAMAYANYAARDTGGDGGQWFVQTTVRGLLSLLKRSEAQVLAAQNGALAARLLPGAVPPGASGAFLHHAQVLAELVSSINPPGQTAYRTLHALYNAARADWATVSAIIGGGSRADAWLRELQAGLDLYAITEGW
ncbi:MAG: hypothetical protein WKF94_11980 [Solirubrobacteraceae bacterium]